MYWPVFVDSIWRAIAILPYRSSTWVKGRSFRDIRPVKVCCIACGACRRKHFRNERNRFVATVTDSILGAAMICPAEKHIYSTFTRKVKFFVSIIQESYSPCSGAPPRCRSIVSDSSTVLKQFEELELSLEISSWPSIVLSQKLNNSKKTNALKINPQRCEQICSRTTMTSKKKIWS